MKLVEGNLKTRAASGIAFFDELIDEVPPSCRISANDLD